MGKPLIAWTIEEALKSGCFDSVVVSTEDKEIADIAIEYGAEVPFLREKYYDDKSTTAQAICETLLRLNGGFSTVIQLMANCPLRNSDDIQKAVKYFDGSSAQAQVGCFKFGWMNPWWAAKLDENSRPLPLFPEALSMKSQALPDLYCPTGAISVSTVDALLKNVTFYSQGHIFYEMDWKSAVDIDNFNDIEFAEAVRIMRMKRSYL
jgi:N-acylneuraminate cytidylyltransferase